MGSMSVVEAREFAKRLHAPAAACPRPVPQDPASYDFLGRRSTAGTNYRTDPFARRFKNLHSHPFLSFGVSSDSLTARFLPYSRLVSCHTLLSKATCYLDRSYQAGR